MESPVAQEWQEPPLPEAVKIAPKKPLIARYASFGAFGLGVTLTILSAAGIIPVLLNLGIILILFGVVLFGLSFISLPETVGDDKPMPVYELLIKVFYAPVEAFRNLRSYPRFVTALLMMAIAWSVYQTAFTAKLTPEKIVDFSINKLAQSGFELPPKAIAEQRRMQMEQLTNPVAKAANGVSTFIGYFLGFAAIAAVYLVIVLAMGGTINFWQSFAAVVHAYFPAWMLNSVLSLVILFFKDASDIHPILGAQQGLVTENLSILVAPADNVILWALLSAISLFGFYSLWLVATGLKNAGERVSASAAWTAAIVVWGVALCLGIASAAAFSSFLT